MSKKKFNLTSIRSKLIISLLSMCLIPLIITGFFSYNESKAILNGKLNLTSTQTTAEINDGLTNYLNKFINVISSTAKNPSIVNSGSDINTEIISETFKGINDSDKDIMAIYYGTAERKFNIYPEMKMPDGYDPTSRPWYKQALENKGKTIVTPPYKDASTGNSVVTIAHTVEKDGQVIGVVGADCTLATLAEKIASKKIGNTGYVFIADGIGNIVAHPKKELIGTDEASKLSFWEKAKSEKSGFVNYEYSGLNKFGVYETNELTGWKLVATIDEKELTNDTKSILMTTGLVILVVALAAIVLSLLLSKGIADNIKKLKEVFAKASNGDLSTAIDVKSKDELGELGKDYNSMIHNIGTLLDSARQSSNVVVTTALSLSAMAEETSASMSQVSQAVSEIAQGANNLAENSQNTASGIGQLSDRLDIIAQVTNEMNDVSVETKELSAKGIDSVNILIEKNKETMEASLKVYDIVSDMDNSVKEISVISDAINSITEQTNLLSLNASIEAARAGEAGRGFAVVADEIRKLAEESKRSTEQIKDIIEAIQLKATTAVQAMDGTKKINVEQNQAVSTTETIFTNISSSITALTEKVENVRKSIDDMQVQKESFVIQVENTSAISEETASATEEVTASTEQVTATMTQFTDHTEELKQLAEKLKSEIDKFII